MNSGIIAACFIFYASFAFGQKAPIKFGHIEKAELEMKVYGLDTSAPAVVLCNYGYFDPTSFLFTRLFRVKVLRKEGYAWADHTFSTSSKTNIRGMTYNLENGEIVEEKLKSSSIYEVKVTDGYYNMRVAMPNVKVGSVIDIEFTHFGPPMEWHFQETIPVQWSELNMVEIPAISFRKNFVGFRSLFISTDDRWVAKNVPAFKPEPYLTSVNNCLTKFEFEILAVNVPGHHVTYTTDWGSVAAFLSSHEKFGIALEGSLYLNGVANEIKESALTEEKKIEAAFNAIKKVKWNEEQRVFASSPNLSYPYKEQTGNSADINLELLQLLRKLDFRAYPVVLSTRENGEIKQEFPSLNKLNHVIVCVKLNGRDYFLDATEDYMPYDLLPEKCINGNGLLIDDKKWNWVFLIPEKKYKEKMVYNLKVTEDLNFEGSISGVRYDYAGYQFRKKFNSFNSKEEYLNDFRKDKAGLNIMNAEVENTDSFALAVKDKYEVAIKGQVAQANKDFYFYPLLYERITENPFWSDERSYPVDFTYPIEKTLTLNISLPANMQVAELPKSEKFTLPDDGGYFLYQIADMGNQVSLNCKFVLNKEVFIYNEYPDLKEFFSQIIRKDAEPVFLKIKE